MNKSLSQAELAATERPFTIGEFETAKHAGRRPGYYAALDQIASMGYQPADLIHHFPAFTGNLTLIRYLTLYEMYKKAQGLAGHIAEVGVDMGASSLLFAKLIQTFEPDALTMVHGFDWFQGYRAAEDDVLLKDGAASEPEARVRELVKIQGLDNILKIHTLDVTKDMDAFFTKHPHLRFKLLYLDSGTYPVTLAAIKALWPRLLPGGIMVLDQYNNEVGPGEVRAVSELLPDYKVETLNNSWYPNAFIQKPFAK